MAKLIGRNIANVERVKVVTADETPRTLVFETSTSVKYTSSVSEGKEVEQRVKNQLLGLLKTEDLTKGYDLSVTDGRMIGEFYALIDGGTLTGTGDEFTAYQSPVAGAAVERTKFTLTLYTSDRDTDGSVKKYMAWEFKNCTGKPVDGGAEDGSFSDIEYSIESRPAGGESALTVTVIDALPDIT